MLERTDIPDDARIRLVLLYALRYEKSQSNATPQLLDLLARTGVSDKKIAVILVFTRTSPSSNSYPSLESQLVGWIIQYAGTDQRLEDLFSNQNVFARTKNVFKGLQVCSPSLMSFRISINDSADAVQGVENIYTQHAPHLVETLQECIKGRLKEQLYPFIEGNTRDK